MHLCALPAPTVTVELGGGAVKRSGIWCEERAESALSPCMGVRATQVMSGVAGGRTDAQAWLWQQLRPLAAQSRLLIPWGWSLGLANIYSIQTL